MLACQRSLTDEEARAGGATERGFDVSPHLDSLAQMSKVHVQQKRQEIAHAKTSLDKAMAEVRECQRAEAAEFDGRVAELKGEFNEQLAQLEVRPPLALAPTAPHAHTLPPRVLSAAPVLPGRETLVQNVVTATTPCKSHGDG